jgi:hypothetical protein
MGKGVRSLLVRQAFELVRSLNLDTIVACLADGRDVQAVGAHRESERLIWLVDRQAEMATSEHDRIVRLPASIPALRRSGSRLRLGLFLAAVHRYVGLDDNVVCLLGGVHDGPVDTIVVTNPRRDFPWLGADDRIDSLRSFSALVGVIEIAVRLATEGREGRPLGTIFVVGDAEQLRPYVRQLILNPCFGHPRERRSINRPEFVETIRELAAVDGAFIIDREGVVESAGAYLDAPADEVRVARGLGARHAAAAAVTTVTDAAAVVVSESSGAVTVYHRGAPILTFDER